MSDQQDKLWGVSITTASADIGLSVGREINTEVLAKSGQDAIIKAVSEFELQDGELFHTVHVGPPFDRRDMPNELLEAAKGVLSLLKASTDHRDFLASIDKASDKENMKALDDIRAKDRVSPAEKLRQQADEMEAKDAIIHRFRAAVAAFE